MGPKARWLPSENVPKVVQNRSGRRDGEPRLCQPELVLILARMVTLAGKRGHVFHDPHERSSHWISNLALNELRCQVLVEIPPRDSLAEDVQRVATGGCRFVPLPVRKQLLCAPHGLHDSPKPLRISKSEVS